MVRQGDLVARLALLSKLRNLALPLLSVKLVDPADQEATAQKFDAKLEEQLTRGDFAMQGDNPTMHSEIYEIRVKGRLDGDNWAQWFDGMTVKGCENGETILTGPVADQAALYGLLSRLRDLALPLLSLNRR